MEKSNKSEFKQIDDKIHLSLEYVCYFKSKWKYEETNCISIRSKFEHFEETLGKIRKNSFVVYTIELLNNYRKK